MYFWSHVIVRAFKEHLSLEVHNAPFFGSLEGAKQSFVELLHLRIIKELAKLYHILAFRIALSKANHVLLKFLHLLVNLAPTSRQLTVREPSDKRMHEEL